jgi:type I restriction enzyme S subunit
LGALYKDDFKSIEFLYPPLEEQTTIAQYLDNKTRAIDKKINLLTKKAETYKELRKSIINDAVCKGLDKNVKLKESGIDWIGKIPEHWKVERLKALGDFETSSVNKKIEEEEELVKLVNYTDVYGNMNKEVWNSDSYMVVSANKLQLRFKRLRQGDVLFTPSSETIADIGVSAVVMEDLKNTLYSYHILRLRFSLKIQLNFKKYLFNNDFVQEYFSKSATGTTRKILGLNTNVV